MANVAVTFNADEIVTQSFERTCADVGVSVSAGFNILMRTAIREQRLLFGEAEAGATLFQQQQKKAAHEFVAGNHSAESELSTDDFSELESGKYRLDFGKRELAL